MNIREYIERKFPNLTRGQQQMLMSYCRLQEFYIQENEDESFVMVETLVDNNYNAFWPKES